jgi:uncharacterized repeat protein (TIGR03803 family)
MKTHHQFSFVLLVATLFWLTPALASGQAEKVLHAFERLDGVNPYFAGVIFDSAGNLYGTTTFGGEGCSGTGCGTVFELSPNADGSWTESVIHNFAGGTDGQSPLGGLIFDDAGNLYGTTSGNGAPGTVFELSPGLGGGWTEKILYNFKGGEDGSAPIGSLVFDPAGNLYGTTTGGGTHNGGTVFELQRVAGGTWNKSTIHNFRIGTDGHYPWGNLIFDPEGNLYGTTDQGGPHGWGIVFELTRTSGGVWAEHQLHGFGAKGDGAQPEEGLVLDASGNLYGGTVSGGSHGRGIVFELSPTSGGWAERIIYYFSSESSGWAPGGNLLLDSAGNLYGETFEGGTGGCIRGGCGVVFELSPMAGGPWKETVLMDASANIDGGVPWGGLTFDAAGNLYGTTYGGSGHGAYYGTVFEVTR